MKSPHAAELLGRNLRVTAHTDVTLVGRAGRVVDETRETLLIETPRGEVRIAKRQAAFALDGESEPVTLAGRRLAYRSADRVKRGL